MAEEQIDFEDEEYGGAQKLQYQGSGGAISALADEEPMGEDDEYDDLYNDVNIGEGFLQLHQSEAPLPPGGVSNGGLQAQKNNFPEPRGETGGFDEENIPGVSAEGKYSNAGSQFPVQKEGLAVDNKSEVGSMGYPNGAASVSQKGRIMDVTHDTQGRHMGFQGSTSMPHAPGVDSSDIPVKVANENVPSLNSGGTAPRGVPQTLGNQTNANVSVNRPMVNENQIRPPTENGSTMLFVGELHWWTTDAELESVLSQYGRVKEIKFFDERASGKSKGYCQIEFYDAAAAAACKEGMHGYVFNGRACVVTFASSQTLKQMGAAYMNKNQPQNQSQPQGRRPVNDGAGRGGNPNYQSGDAGRNFGRGGWGRGGQGILNRGPGGGGPMRGRGGPMGAKNMVGGNVGVVGSVSGGGGYGQGLAGPAFGGPAGGMMNPQGMMGSGFDPSYMGRGGGYGGFPGPAFPGMLPSFPGVNAMGLAAVAPHVNPAFFGRGMTNNGMGMMGSSLMDGHHAGMWNDTSMGGWGGEEQGRRTRESSYGGDDGASEYGYGEANHEKGVRSSAASRERERGSDRDRSGNSERRHHEERDQDWDRSDKEQREHRYREEKDGYREHRQRERDVDYDDDWDRGQSSSRPRSRSRVMPEDHHRSRSRDVDYGKRRRLPSE
ncbi:Splicing factor-like protein [Parasponia andersonii]|uniref:Splicing factor-like protein n=1 Tax=Parasponia andersonii TaxID=3476 RepID=A0A2P5B0L4_PARAD|nr:Splicing factor-like protein [Parasponia andersonii]